LIHAARRILFMSETATKTRWQLTQTAFDRLLAALAPSREEASEKYLSLRKNLARFFEARGFQTAEDAADEVMNRLARKLETSDQIENINTYALGVARMLALELHKSPARKTTDIIPEISVSPIDKEREQKEENLKCLEKCLRQLSDENRQIIVGYYQGEKREKIENRQKLADALGIPNNALRNRAVRLRDKLEVCLTDCLSGKKLL
jgi:RNA polymerase sigma factor (sigma-70 family)